MAGFRIKEFPQDGAYWRVVWVGEISPNIEVESEPKIDILLNKLKDGYSDVLSSQSHTDQYVVKAIGLGQFPLIRAGSVWKDGLFCSFISMADPNKYAEFEINTEEELEPEFKFEFGQQILLEDEFVPLIPPKYYKIGKEYFRKAAGSYLSVFPSSVPKYKFCILPHFELLRFYYIPSSTLAHYIWQDALGDAINQSKSALLEGNDVRIHLRRNIKDREAYFIARWFLSDKMRMEITSFRNSNIRLAANRSKSTPLAIQPGIGFPFDGKTKLKALGKSIRLTERKDGRPVWAFLVLHLLHCSYPMPYRNIVVDRDNRNLKGENSEDPSLLPAWVLEQEKEIGKDNDESDVALLASDEEPNKNIRKRTNELYEQQFNLHDHRLIKEDVEVQQYKSVKEIRTGDSFVDQYGTGEGQYGESGTGPAEITNTFPLKQERYLVTLMPFIEALKWLRNQPGISIETSPLGGEYIPIAGEYLYLLPMRIKKMRSWHIMNSEPPRPRGIMVAKCVLDGQTIYFMEIERKDKDESFATLVFRSHLSNTEDSHIKFFLMKTARKNRWPSKDEEGLHHFEYVGVDHYKDDTPEKFGQRLLDVVSPP